MANHGSPFQTEGRYDWPIMVAPFKRRAVMIGHVQQPVTIDVLANLALLAIGEALPSIIAVVSTVKHLSLRIA